MSSGETTAKQGACHAHEGHEATAALMLMCGYGEWNTGREGNANGKVNACVQNDADDGAVKQLELTLRRLRNDVVGNPARKRIWAERGALTLVTRVLKDAHDKINEIGGQARETVKVYALVAEHCVAILGSFVATRPGRELVLRDADGASVREIARALHSDGMESMERVKLAAVRAVKELLRDRVGLMNVVGAAATGRESIAGREDPLDSILNGKRTAAVILSLSTHPSIDIAEVAALFVAAYCSAVGTNADRGVRGIEQTSTSASRTDPLRERQSNVLKLDGAHRMRVLLVRCARLCEGEAMSSTNQSRNMRGTGGGQTAVVGSTFGARNAGKHRGSIEQCYRYLESVLYAIQGLVVDNCDACEQLLRSPHSHEPRAASGGAGAARDGPSGWDELTIQILRRLSKEPQVASHARGQGKSGHVTDAAHEDDTGPAAWNRDADRHTRNPSSDGVADAKNRINFLSCLLLSNICNVYSESPDIGASGAGHQEDGGRCQRRGAVATVMTDPGADRSRRATASASRISGALSASECTIIMNELLPRAMAMFDVQTLSSVQSYCSGLKIGVDVRPDGAAGPPSYLKGFVNRLSLEDYGVVCGPLLLRHILKDKAFLQDGASGKSSEVVNKLSHLLEILRRIFPLGAGYIRAEATPGAGVNPHETAGGDRSDVSAGPTRASILSLALEDTLLCLAALCAHHDSIRQQLVDADCLTNVVAIISNLQLIVGTLHFREVLDRWQPELNRHPAIGIAAIEVVRNMSRSVRHLRTSFSPDSTRRVLNRNSAYEVDALEQIVKPLIQVIQTIDESGDRVDRIKSRIIAPQNASSGSAYFVGLKTVALQTLANFSLAPPSRKHAILQLGLMDVVVKQLVGADDTESGGRGVSVTGPREAVRVSRHHVLLILKNMTYSAPFSVRSWVLLALADRVPSTAGNSAAVVASTESVPAGPTRILDVLLADDAHEEIVCSTLCILENILYPYDVPSKPFADSPSERSASLCDMDYQELLRLCGGTAFLVSLSESIIRRAIEGKKWETAVARTLRLACNLATQPRSKELIASSLIRVALRWIKETDVRISAFGDADRVHGERLSRGELQRKVCNARAFVPHLVNALLKGQSRCGGGGGGSGGNGEPSGLGSAITPRNQDDADVAQRAAIIRSIEAGHAAEGERPGEDIVMGGSDSSDLARLRGLLNEISQDRDILDVSFAADVALAALR